MIVYADVLIVVNLLITYFLLIASSVITGYTYSRKRIITASSLGGIFCLYIFIQSENAYIDLAVKIISLILCSMIAFGKRNIKKLMIQTICFVMMNMLIMGLMIFLSLQSNMIYHNNMFFYLNINPVIMVISSLIIYFFVTACSMIKERIYPQKTYKAEIFFKNFTISGISAFYDSGFKVKDIISNKDVMFISIVKISDKIPLEIKKDIYNFLDGKYKEVQTIFVPVFFKTITGEGVVPAIKAEKLILENVKLENILIGFINNDLSENVTAIFGTDIKRML